MPWINDQTYKPCCVWMERALSKGLPFYEIRVNHGGMQVRHDIFDYATLRYCPNCREKLGMEINKEMINKLKEEYKIIGINYYIFDTTTDEQQHLADQNCEEYFPIDEYTTEDIFGFCKELENEGYIYEEMQEAEAGRVRIYMYKEI